MSRESSDRQRMLTRIRDSLRAVHGERLRGVILFGSEARGEAGPDSDIDLLVLLRGPVVYGRDLESNLTALYPLAHELNRRISAKPVDETKFESVECPLFRNARDEGIRL